MLSISPNSMNRISFGEIFMNQRPIRGIEEKFSNELSSDSVTTSKNPVNCKALVVQISGRITPDLQELLLGLAPLRLVMARVPQFFPPNPRPEYWIETLECGHTTEAYLSFKWDEGGHLVNLIPSAKRRRCQPCKSLEALSLPPKKPAESVREITDKKVGEK